MLASQAWHQKFQLHLNSSLDVRKASNSANAQLTVGNQRLLRLLLYSSPQFMPPKVLASLESQLPSGLVTWLWSSNFKIECYISRLITQLGIKTTFVSCPALLQWRRDACRRLERNTKVSVGVLLPSQPRTRTHVLCFLALTFYFSHQASGSLL